MHISFRCGPSILVKMEFGDVDFSVDGRNPEYDTRRKTIAARLTTNSTNRMAPSLSQE